MSSTYDPSFEDFLRDIFDIDAASRSTQDPNLDSQFGNVLGDSYDINTWNSNSNFKDTAPPHQSNEFQTIDSADSGLCSDDLQSLFGGAEVSRGANSSSQLSEPIDPGVSFFFRSTLRGRAVGCSYGSGGIPHHD